MFNNFKLKTVLYTFLVVCVLSSNNIIIYNEELLVALSFFLFVVFVARYYGNVIQESLDSSSQDIRELCENLTNSKQQYLQELSLQFERSEKYPSVFTALKKVTQEKVTRKKGLTQSLWSHFYQQTALKCVTLMESQERSKPVFLNTMAKNQYDLVLTSYAKQKEKSGKLDPKLLKSGIGVMTKKEKVSK